MTNIKILFLLFITYSIIGWIMEMIVTVIRNKEIVNRGFLIGPYCPIYGTCSIAMILLLSKVTNSILLFILSIIICSVGEYITSYLMEKLFKARWWDYSHKKFNLNGRICLQNCLAFGVLGFIMIKFVNTFFVNIYSSFSISTLNILFYILLVIFITDLIISFNVVIKIKNMSLKYVNLDNTKEITNKIKSIISEKVLNRRLFKAFPYLSKSIKDKIKLLIKRKK
ncbi:MAG: putative ABC transporter permease [Bacilli bacterium]|nr:putative ABC transporter permease [Bacilli bacterium]